MSMEEALDRLASAVLKQGELSAVAEIIRQRNEAIRSRDFWEREAADLLRRKNQLFNDLAHERRVSCGLRSAIKRMKSARKDNTR